MNTHKPFVTGMTIQVTPAMIAAMGGNPATMLAESLRDLATHLGREEVDRLGELFRYRVVNGEIVIDLSLSATKNFFEFFNSVFLPAIGNIGNAIEICKAESPDGQPNVEQLNAMLFGVNQDLMAKAATMVAGRMPEGNMLPTMPASLTAH
jgi:hypothetical protein